MSPMAADGGDAAAHGTTPAERSDRPEDDPTAPAAATDPLVQLREELSSLDGRPVGKHIPVYERANAVVAAELAALDEV